MDLLPAEGLDDGLADLTQTDAVLGQRRVLRMTPKMLRVAGSCVPTQQQIR
jgi:hypothetical protein